jgi:hypothetical protein
MKAKVLSMKTMKLMCILAMAFLVTGLQAQVIRVDVKITDNEGKVAMVTAATSSSATGCASPDFPVYRNGIKEQVLMDDYKYISVMPYETPSNEALYVVVELETPKGGTERVEMSRYLRFSGRSVTGDAALQLKDISMIEVFVEKE